MGALVTNNAVGALASSINDTDLTLTLGSGQGALFPAPGAGEYFFATIISAANVKEIIKCTARATNTLTIVRGQDNTTAVSFAAGSRVELRYVAALHNVYAQDDVDNEWSELQTFLDGLTSETVINITGAAATDRFLKFQTAGVDRWAMGANTDAESTLEAGSNFGLYSYTDAGAQEFNPLLINRATGIMTLIAGSKVGGDTIDHFPSGTIMIFRQTAAPTGWTKQTDVTDSMLRFTSGTLADRFNSARKVTDLLVSRTILQANLPSVNLSGTTGTESNDHTHQVTNDGGSGSSPGSAAFRTSDIAGSSRTETSSGLSATHTHAVTVALGGSGTAMDFAVNYVDVIGAVKV